MSIRPRPPTRGAWREAKIVFTNGLSFEGWIDRLVKSSGTKAPCVEAAQGRRSRCEARRTAMGRATATAEPSIRMPGRMSAMRRSTSANIRDALIAADPAGRAAYEANAAAYLAQLDALDAEVQGPGRPIPAERRRIITSHDAFRYFEAAYGVDFVAPQGVSTEAEASAKDVARIIRQIRREKIRRCSSRTSPTRA